MSDLRFESSLSMEEIENNFKDVDLFSGIMASLQDAVRRKTDGVTDDGLEEGR